MKELDIVTLLKDYPEFELTAGAVGTIVHEHVLVEGLPPSVMVEFMSLSDPYDSIVETIALADLRPTTEAELADRRAKRVAAE